MAAVLAAASCVEPLNNVNPVQGQGQDLKLSFSCGVMTKAPVEGTGNENLVKRIDYFIFAYGEDGKVADDAEYVYTNYITTTAANNTVLSYEETIAHEYLDDIFPNGADKAVVFAVANYVDKFGYNNDMTDSPNTTIPADVKTWKGLHELEVGSTFFYDDKDPNFKLRWPHVLKPDAEDLFFVMAADSAVISLVATANEEAGGAVVNGVVPLERLASKVTVNFDYEIVKETKANGDVITWVPQSESPETRVYMSNAIEHTTLGGPLQRTLVADSDENATKPLGNGTRDIFEYAYNFMNSIPAVDGKRTAHFYTYPLQFEEGDDNQPYLKLVLPWYGYKNYEDAENRTLYKQKEVYYKIVLPRETLNEPNRIYEYSVDVNIIGNDKDVEVTGYQYVVKNWLSDKAINSNVAMGKYISLDIPKDKYDMYGDDLEVLFVSSGEVEISQLQIKKPNINGDPNIDTNRIVLRKNANGSLTYGTYSTRTGDGTSGNRYRYGTANYSANTPDANGVTVPNWTDIDGSHLVINHALRSDLSRDDVDITPYIFVVTLHLKGETSTRFDRTVTITQYPPIYAESLSTSSSNTVFLNGRQYSTTQSNVTNSANESLGTIGQNDSQTSNTRTIVTVTDLNGMDITRYTQLGIGTPVIGDPRITLEGNYPVNPYVSTQSWDANDINDEHIKDYQYTDINKTNVIAPKFMLASGYGSCAGNKVDWVHSAERCAAYQEDGYPAGRWRLPTEAEILFVYTLAHDRALIANPFYSTSHYWANSARQYYNEAFNTIQTGAAGSLNANGWSTRCVYDLWYWGDDPVLSTTTTPAINAWSGFMTTK